MSVPRLSSVVQSIPIVYINLVTAIRYRMLILFTLILLGVNDWAYGIPYDNSVLGYVVCNTELMVLMLYYNTVSVTVSVTPCYPRRGHPTPLRIYIYTAWQIWGKNTLLST